jgi:hypothetical protein
MSYYTIIVFNQFDKRLNALQMSNLMSYKCIVYRFVILIILIQFTSQIVCNLILLTFNNTIYVCDVP